MSRQDQAHPRRRKLNGEGNAVKVVAKPGHCLRILWREREARSLEARPLYKEAHRLEPFQFCQVHLRPARTGCAVFATRYAKQFVFGSSLSDGITGGDLADKLYGMEGNDKLTGGIGDDYLEGGKGTDVYYYKAGDGNDTIFDHDGLGHIVYIDANGNETLLVGGVKQDTASDTYTSVDRRIIYQRQGSDLLITFADGGPYLEIRSLEPDGRPFDNYYTHGWREGVERIEAVLVFEVRRFEPRAVLTIRDVVVR